MHDAQLVHISLHATTQYEHTAQVGHLIRREHGSTLSVEIEVGVGTAAFVDHHRELVPLGIAEVVGRHQRLPTIAIEGEMSIGSRHHQAGMVVVQTEDGGQCLLCQVDTEPELHQIVLVALGGTVGEVDGETLLRLYLKRIVDACLIPGCSCRHREIAGSHLLRHLRAIPLVHRPVGHEVGCKLVLGLGAF